MPNWALVKLTLSWQSNIGGHFRHGQDWLLWSQILNNPTNFWKGVQSPGSPTWQDTVLESSGFVNSDGNRCHQGTCSNLHFKHHLPLFFLLYIGLCRFHITQIVWSHQPFSFMIGLFEYQSRRSLRFLIIFDKSRPLRDLFVSIWPPLPGRLDQSGPFWGHAPEVAQSVKGSQKTQEKV